MAREIRHSRLNSQEGKKIISHYDSNPVYIKDFFKWLEVSDSGYEWFISHKLHSVKHLISDKKIEALKSVNVLPDKLIKNISGGKTPKKSFETFLKGIRL